MKVTTQLARTGTPAASPLSGSPIVDTVPQNSGGRGASRFALLFPADTGLLLLGSMIGIVVAKPLPEAAAIIIG